MSTLEIHLSEEVLNSIPNVRDYKDEFHRTKNPKEERDWAFANHISRDYPDRLIRGEIKYIKTENEPNRITTQKEIIKMAYVIGKGVDFKKEVLFLTEEFPHKDEYGTVKTIPFGDILEYKPLSLQTD